MADYAAKPTKAKEDTGIIELRKRMLAVFLNRCRRMREVLEDGVWWRFLDPNVSWVRPYQILSLSLTDKLRLERGFKHSSCR
jgi:sorting nexin-41/42